MSNAIHGWQCPQCLVVHAPFVRSCHCCVKGPYQQALEQMGPCQERSLGDLINRYGGFCRPTPLDPKGL